MRAREEAAAYAGRAWLKMSRADRRAAVRLIRKIRDTRRLVLAHPYEQYGRINRAYVDRHWLSVKRFYALVERSEGRVYTAREARETAEKCADIHRAQTTKKGKQK